MKRIITDPSNTGLWVYFFVLFLILVALPCRSDTDTNILPALRWLVEDREPGHPFNRRPERLESFAADVVQVATEYDLDPYLLAAMAWHETRFMNNRVGRLGERGVVQVHGVGARRCDFSTPLGSLKCGAAWLRGRIDVCGSVRRGLNAYATGRCKVLPNTHADKSILRRLRLAQKLRAYYAKTN